MTDEQSALNSAWSSLIPRTHADSVLELADAMLRAALWPGVAAVVVGVAAANVFAGLIGCASSLARSG